MAQLHPFKFPELPPEIRIQIWETALHQETEKRLVVVDSRERAVLPMRRLISPLLMVNSESRKIAKAFFNFTLNVHHVLGSTGRNRGRRLEHVATGPSAGKLYLSLDRDLFVKGLRWEECRYAEHLNSDLEILFKYDSKPMGSDDCDRVQRVLDIEYELYEQFGQFGQFGQCVPIVDCSFCGGWCAWHDDNYPYSWKCLEKQWLFSRATDYFKIDVHIGFRDDDGFPGESQIPKINLPMILELGGEGILALPWVQKRLSHQIIDRTLV
ncbi:hypothetical protein F4776DRAFT_221232 [Hypoxylon sp. NC0597]|nr:hypothetical protein F4776DRAFT_221232 [Hypoxylon sp. NC0597]